MSSQRSLRVLASLFFGFVVGLGWAGGAAAKLSFAIGNGNSCKDNGCHVNVETGRIQVIGTAGVLDIGTHLDGTVRGGLQLFQIEPGNTVTMSVEVLNGAPVFALQLKRLETSGQLNDLANFMTWLEDNLAGNTWTRQEVSNPPYFTKDNGNDGGIPASEAGVFSFDLFVDAATPPDVYDLEFAIAGKLGSEELYYQDEHFYLEVVPEPAVGGSALAVFAALGAVAGARRRATS